MIVWVGYIYVQAELPRISNEKLLNNLKEGVFIIEDESSLVLFQNRAAKRFNVRIKETSNVRIIDESESLNKMQKQFALVDSASIFKSMGFTSDYNMTIKRLKECENYMSFEDIISSKCSGKIG